MRIRASASGCVAGLVLMLAPVVGLVPSLSRAQAVPAPLQVADVLAVLDDTHPVLEAVARERARAEAERFGAYGAWDPTIEVEGKLAPVGYYENGQLQARVKQATPLWGAGLYAGYRLGAGDFPVYKGEYETLSAGELRAGVELPLWKDRAIDERRAAIRSREALVGGAECTQQAARLQVRRDAARAYWEWVQAGLALDIQADLLAVAKQREAGLRKQVELGSAAPILVVDNARLVLEREAKWVGAQRDFQRAGLQLSLFLRDAQQRPVVPVVGRVPKAVPELGRVKHAGDVDEALKARPELCQLQAEFSAAAVALALADNQRAPSVNAHAFVARDLGDGPGSLAPAEVGLALRFAMPLTLRKARGKQRAAQAKVAVIDAKLRGLRDKIATQVQQARVDLDAAHKQLVVVRAQKTAADTLAEGEREKFAQGASDLVVVNLREIAAAEAARAELEALVSLHKAHVDYLTATGEGI